MRAITFSLLTFTLLVMANQRSMLIRQTGSSGWSVDISRTWNVLGPFPIHAREQQYVSPSFPLNLSEPIDVAKKWPSSYADNGMVEWSQATSEENGDLKISFPDVRWTNLRATEGWAALQHHAILHATLKIIPPQGEPVPPPPLLIHLIQGSYFTLLDKARSSVPRWHAGNMYAIGNALPRAVALPSIPSNTQETEYDLFVSGDYEIRLFGDPTAYGSEIPIQSLNIQASFDESTLPVVHEPEQNVIPDFIEGFAMGNAIGIGLRSVDQWWNVTRVSLSDSDEDGFSVHLLHPVQLAPTQMRILPVVITQTAAFRKASVSVSVALSALDGQGIDFVLNVTLPISHAPIWTQTSYTNIKLTYLYASTMPTTFVAKPPLQENSGEPKPVVLALHGAGVDVVGSSLWSDALARQPGSWVVMPTGRTTWGLDWHGPSAKDAWDSVTSLGNILHNRGIFAPWRTKQDAPVILLGHSNGGQGAWYLAARFPDKVLAVVPASGYIKSQQYIPWTLSRSSHFVDPILQAILQTSLTPDDNDLFLTNLVSTPVLAVHGGADDNVPTWHSREYISAIKYLYPAANATLREDPGQGHFYPTVVNNPQVQAFIDFAVSADQNDPLPSEFTLTTAIPNNSGSLHGFSIVELKIPGRLGRVNVRFANGHVTVRTNNIQSFSVNRELLASSASIISVDQTQSLPITDTGVYVSTEQGGWDIATSALKGLQAGRIQQFLTTNGSITFIIPDGKPENELSIATRLAHDLASYHNLDSQILEYSKVDEESLGGGNHAIIAQGVNPFVSKSLSAGPKVFNTDGQKLTIMGKPVTEPGTGFVFLHPSPFKAGLSLFMLANDAEGLERAARLFPIRTGVAIPDWIITGPRADSFGSGGIIGAGVWGPSWTWSEGFSWLGM